MMQAVYTNGAPDRSEALRRDILRDVLPQQRQREAAATDTERFDDARRLVAAALLRMDEEIEKLRKVVQSSQHAPTPPALEGDAL